MASGSAAERMQSALDSIWTRYSVTAGGERAGRYRAYCVAAVAALPVAGVSLSLLDPDGGSTLLAASDDRSERVAELQFTTGDGPSQQAAASGTPQLEPHFGAARWPLFAPSAQELGVRAMFVFPLQLGAIRIGVLSLHHHRPGALTGSQLAAVAALLKAVLAAVLSDLDTEPSAGGGWGAEVDGYGDQIHQATGMALAQLGVSAEAALLRLRGHAFSTGRPLAEVATDVVARRLSFAREADDRPWEE